MNDYKVKDLYEAAFLYSQKKFFKGLMRENNYFVFIFGDRDACERLADQYWSGTVKGNLKDFADSLKTLKERLFAHK